MLSSRYLRLAVVVALVLCLPLWIVPASRTAEPLKNDYTIRGRCVDHFDSGPLAGMTILLYKGEGRVSPPVKVGQTTTDSKGRFEFNGLEPPRDGERLDPLKYGAFAKGGDRPYGVQFHSSSSRNPEEMEIRMAREKATLVG